MQPARPAAICVQGGPVSVAHLCLWWFASLHHKSFGLRSVTQLTNAQLATAIFFSRRLCSKPSSSLVQPLLLRSHKAKPDRHEISKEISFEFKSYHEIQHRTITRLPVVSEIKTKIQQRRKVGFLPRDEPAVSSSACERTN